MEKIELLGLLRKISDLLDEGKINPHLISEKIAEVQYLTCYARNRLIEEDE